MAEELLQIRVTADFKEAEGAFLRLAKVATSFESNIRTIAGNLNKDFNRINGMAELFGDTSNVVKDKMEALKRAMNSLMTNGFQALNPEVQKLKAQYDALASSLTPIPGKLDQSGKALKKSNMQWTNFALVLQDLPYGFRGIQNNLPALVGGIAGMTGGIYLASSAIIALFTAWDNGMIKFGESTKLSAEYAKEAATNYASEKVQLDSLYRVATNSNISMEERIKASKTLKEEYPGLLNTYSLEEIALGKADVAYKKLTKTLWEYAQAKAAEKTLEDLAAKKQVLAIERTDLLAKKRAAEAKVKPFQVSTTYGEKTISDAEFNLRMINNSLKNNENAQKDINKQAASYLAISDATINSVAELDKFKEKPDNKKATSDAKARIKLEKETNLQLLQSKQQTYKDDILLYKEYEIKIIDLREEQSLAEAEAVGASEQTLQNIRDIAANNRLKARQELSAKIQKLIEDDVKEELKAEKEKERISKDFINAYKSDINQQESDFNQFYKTKMDLATGDLEGQKEILLQQGAQIEEFAIISKGAWGGYSQAVGENVKAVADISLKITKQAFDSMMQMGNAIMNALGPSLDMLLEKGASIGDVLTNAFQSVLKQLAKVVISAAIAVALLAILFPKMLAKAGGAGTVFKGLIGQGMGIGGLIGGGGTSKGVDATNGTNAINTIQSNSSADNSGQFVLRGNDLVLALNRSETSLNLRRGS